MTAQPERSSTALPVKTRVPFRRPAGRAKVTRSPTRTPSSSVASRLEVPTSTNISSSGIAFLASSGGRTCAGFAPVTPSTGPLRPWMRRSWSITMRSSWYPTGAMRTKPSSSTCWTTKPSSSMCAHSITVGAPGVPVRMKKWFPSGSDSWRSWWPASSSAIRSATADSSPETPVAASRRPSRERVRSGMAPTLPARALRSERAHRPPRAVRLPPLDLPVPHVRPGRRERLARRRLVPGAALRARRAHVGRGRARRRPDRRRRPRRGAAHARRRLRSRGVRPRAAGDRRARARVPPAARRPTRSSRS